MVKSIVFPGKTTSHAHFSPDYKLSLFQQWYNTGRLSTKKFYPMIQPDDQGRKPEVSTIMNWIKTEFREQAEVLDKQVLDEMNRRLVQVKIEMLSRHAQIGKEMQNHALEKLRAISEAQQLSEAGALRLLEFSVKLERESQGIPEMLRKIMTKSDDEILDEINTIVKSSKLTLEANVDEELSDL